MKNEVVFLLVLALFSSCTIKPGRLHYAVDSCDFCKMKLMDDKFGGELVTDKGKIFKFDDIKCMVSFLDSPNGHANNYSFELVVDYAHAEDEFDLIPANDAFFVSSPDVKSPMAGNIAAFKNKVVRAEYLKRWNGLDLSWAGIKRNVK
jgi:copper chaperone NosL